MGKERYLRHVELQFFHPFYLAEDLSGRSLHGDLSAVHDKDHIRSDRFLHVVRDQNDRDPLRAVQLHSRADDLLAAVRIQHGRWFVQHDTFGLHGDHTRYRDPLLLSAREAVGRFLAVFPHAHSLKALFYPLPDLLGGDSDILRSESDVFLDDLRNDLIVRILKHHSGLSADLPQILLVFGVKSVYPDSSLSGKQERIDMLGESRFSGSVVSQYRYELSRLHIEVNAVDGALSARHVAFIISLYIIMYQFLYFDHW